MLIRYLKLWSVLPQMVLAVTGYNSSTCVSNQQSSVILDLTQCTDSLIHVKNELIGRPTASCTVQEDECTIVRANVSSRLAVNCNGRGSICGETLSVAADKCDSPRLAVGVSYECIAESHDLCSPNEQVKEGPIYLHSPGFPDSTGVTAPCLCNITGSGIDVEMLELYSQHVLSISADGVRVWPDLRELPIQYNLHVVGAEGRVGRADEVILTYTADNGGFQNVWVKIYGDGPITMKCLGISTVTSSTTVPTSSEPSSPTLTSTTETTSSQRVSSIITTTSGISSPAASPTVDTTDENSKGTPTLTLVAVVVGVIIFVLLAVIVSVIVYIMVWKPSRKTSQNANTHIDGPVYALPTGVQGIPMQSGKGVNTYSNLFQEDQTAHDYGQLHTYDNIRDRQGSPPDDHAYVNAMINGDGQLETEPRP